MLKGGLYDVSMSRAVPLQEQEPLTLTVRDWEA